MEVVTYVTAALFPLFLGLGGFTWAQVVVLAGALIAATGVGATLRANANSARRQTLTTLYGDALGAVSGYLEGPYRILRKDGETSTRFALTSGMSDVKTSIDHHQALMRLHADPVVADAYDHYVTVAKIEAGAQMHIAWNAPPIKRDTDVNLHNPLPRANTDRALKVVVEMMQAHLRRRWYHAATRQRFRSAARAVTAAVEARELEEADRARRNAQADAETAQAGQDQPIDRLIGGGRAVRWLVHQGRRLAR
ncbi:hypothetical protein GCM10011519_32620 [Marmoricola endophyticus]|uniref:Uncharacterized protein n=1 Tax=Marmoricola endophyticus TaxID=2040280 RepID=A0A917F8A2_9ACTN|nr:hypothetical protein [Marmoricola endophyticus]GGF56152.1 hypothetical protein GCM10011519_32620 [Marmoricola endophyticus]